LSNYKYEIKVLSYSNVCDVYQTDHHARTSNRRRVSEFARLLPVGGAKPANRNSLGNACADDRLRVTALPVFRKHPSETRARPDKWTRRTVMPLVTSAAGLDRVGCSAHLHRYETKRVSEIPSDGPKRTREKNTLQRSSLGPTGRRRTIPHDGFVYGVGLFTRPPAQSGRACLVRHAHKSHPDNGPYLRTNIGDMSLVRTYRSKAMYNDDDFFSPETRMTALIINLTFRRGVKKQNRYHHLRTERLSRLPKNTHITINVD